MLTLFLRRLTALLLLAAGAFMAAAAGAQTPQPVPALTARVIDQTGTLDADARQMLEDKLQDFEQRKGTQIVVLMVPATAPEDIAAYANRVANDWKIGRREVGDGLLLIVAKNERRMRIEVAKALEGAVPDIAAARIIDQQMKPAFRNNDFAGGIDAALDQLIARISGEALPEIEMMSSPGSEETSLSGGLFSNLDIEDLLFLFFLPVAVVAGLLRKVVGSFFGATLTAGLASVVIWFITASVLAAVIAAVAALLIASFALAAGKGGGYSGGGGGGGWSSSSSSSDSWSSSSSSGGFSSGGGGDFGGGGASGDW